MIHTVCVNLKKMKKITGPVMALHSGNVAYRKGNFQNHISKNLRTDSSSSLKSVYTKYFSFFEIPSRNGSNQLKTTFSVGKLNLPSIWTFYFFCIFEPLRIEISENERHLVYTIFEEESESTLRFAKA